MNIVSWASCRNISLPVAWVTSRAADRTQRSWLTDYVYKVVSYSCSSSLALLLLYNICLAVFCFPHQLSSSNAPPQKQLRILYKRNYNFSVEVTMFFQWSNYKVEEILIPIDITISLPWEYLWLRIIYGNIWNN